MEDNYQNAYKYLIYIATEEHRSSGGGRTGEKAFRCAAAPAAKANITVHPRKTAFISVYCVCNYVCM